MRKIRKTTGIILTVIMLFTSFSSAFAGIDDVPIPKRLSGEGGSSSKNTIATNEFSGLYKVLNYFGILNEEDANSDGTKELERGYVASVFARFISASGEPDEMTGFSDVSKSTKNAKGIYLALELGVIQKADKFYPSRIITVKEAVKMAMNTLGYTHYPDELSVIQKSRSLGLYKNVGNDSDNLTMGKLMYLLENTLKGTCI